jgi:hypothetical protein
MFMELGNTLRRWPLVRQRLLEIITDSSAPSNHFDDARRNEHLAAISAHEAEQEYFSRGVGKVGLGAEFEPEV